MSNNLALGIFALATALAPWPGLAEAGSPALDGSKAEFSDDLLDEMVGQWTMRGKIMGEPVEHRASVEWVLNHQFLRIHESSVAPMGEGEPPYEAMIFVGYDHMSERYVAHWIDVFGGRASETLGYGQKKGDAIEFLFEYPTAPFRTTFRWDPAARTWAWEMKTKSDAGQWVEFGRQSLERVPSP